jgi:hypothetical protein
MKNWFVKRLVNTEKVEHLRNATCMSSHILLVSSKIDVVILKISNFSSHINLRKTQNQSFFHHPRISVFHKKRKKKKRKEKSNWSFIVEKCVIA